MNIRHLRHTSTCASGARAETRGSCNCGAEQQPPAWSVSVLDTKDAHGHPMIQVFALQELTSGEAVMFSIAIQEATRECGRRYAQTYDRVRRKMVAVAQHQPAVAGCSDADADRDDAPAEAAGDEAPPQPEVA